jgi:hypothetical protein
MNSEKFEQLKASVIEAGRIMKGELNPSRVFTYEVAESPKPLEEVWAICIDSNDHQALIPLKLYHVKYGEHGVWVRDENGEMTSCDADDFLPINFTREIEELLTEAA